MFRYSIPEKDKERHAKPYKIGTTGTVGSQHRKRPQRPQLGAVNLKPKRYIFGFTDQIIQGKLKILNQLSYQKVTVVQRLFSNLDKHMFKSPHCTGIRSVKLTCKSHVS